MTGSEEQLFTSHSDQPKEWMSQQTSAIIVPHGSITAATQNTSFRQSMVRRAPTPW